jgi:hypothetical protein
MIKKFLILVSIFAMVIQCSTKLEDKIDFSFDEKAKYDGEDFIIASSMEQYPGIFKLYDKDKRLRIFRIFYSPKLKESYEFENKSEIIVKYRTERGDPPISYEEACEIVRENQFDMRESITLEDCYGFWGKYARRLGLIDTRREY